MLSKSFLPKDVFDNLVNLFFLYSVFFYFFLDRCWLHFIVLYGVRFGKLSVLFFLS